MGYSAPIEGRHRWLGDEPQVSVWGMLGPSVDQFCLRAEHCEVGAELRTSAKYRIVKATERTSVKCGAMTPISSKTHNLFEEANLQ